MKDKKVVLVVFQNANYGGFEGKQYAYYTDISAKLDDLYVAKVDDRFAVVKVVDDEPKDIKDVSKATKFLVCKIDVTEYEATIAKFEQVKQLKASMNKRFREMSDMMMYEKIAETDPVMAVYLNELKALEG
jgi:hypothetical protein